MVHPRLSTPRVQAEGGCGGAPHLKRINAIRHSGKVSLRIENGRWKRLQQFFAPVTPAGSFLQIETVHGARQAP
jgi:hypothetical protein